MTIFDGEFFLVSSDEVLAVSTSVKGCEIKRPCPLNGSLACPHRLNGFVLGGWPNGFGGGFGGGAEGLAGLIFAKVSEPIPRSEEGWPNTAGRSGGRWLSKPSG